MSRVSLTLYRAPGIEGLLDAQVERALAALPPLSRLERPGVVVLRANCSELLDLAASDPALASLAVLEGPERPPSDSRIDDVVTPRADFAELVMRGGRALARKRVAAAASEVDGVRVTLEGVSWRDLRVDLSSTEVAIVARLLREPGLVITESELCSLDSSGTPMTARALHTHIYRLRKKLRPVTCLTIHSVRQRGFRADVAR